VSDIRHLTIWGNHSATQYPDWSQATIGGRPAEEVVGDRSWLEDTFIPTVAKRGAAIIEARGASSAASAANAAVDHVFDWVNGTPEGDWTSAAIMSDGSYGVPRGIISSFPCTSAGGQWESSRAWRSTTSPAAGSTPRSPSSSRSATPCASWG
jgi:malate dehydrogenase